MDNIYITRLLVTNTTDTNKVTISNQLAVVVAHTPSVFGWLGDYVCVCVCFLFVRFPHLVCLLPAFLLHFKVAAFTFPKTVHGR